MHDAVRPNRAVHQSLRDPGPEWTVADLITVLFRRRGWLLLSITICVGVALLYAAVAPPRYRATAEIEVQNHSDGAFGLENTTSDKSSGDVSDSFEANLNLQTEMGILQSDALALKVIRRTGLEATADYFAPRPSRFLWPSILSSWRKPLEPLRVLIENAPNRRYAALKIFSAHRKVTMVAGTRLISISYSDRDPRRAAEVANALVDSLADYGFESRSSTAAQSASWLAAQLADLKKQTEAFDERAAALDREAGSLGDDDSHNVVLTRLDQLNAALSAAESSRIVREAIWRAVQSGNPEVLSGLGGNPAAGTNTQNSFALLQSLRSQEAAAKAELAESANRYGENWPAVAEQRGRLATIQKSVQEEVRRLGERAHSDYEVSVQAEDSARTAFTQQKNLASRLTGSTVALRLARQEAGESRTLYATLLGRLQQAGVLEGLHPGEFTVVTPAMIPPTHHPSSPNLPLVLAVALGAGICLGATSAVLRELTDDRVHSADDLEMLVEAPLFTAFPTPKSISPRYRRLLPKSGTSLHRLEASGDADCGMQDLDPEYAEALHRLRASLLLSHSQNTPQVVLITATDPQEYGQSAWGTSADPDSSGQKRSHAHALRFAAVLAQHGSPTLYVDADLRSPDPAETYPAASGLSHLLTCDQPPVPDSYPAGQSLLSIIRSGPRPPCPAELIASQRMALLLAQWRKEFAFIVLNAPAAVYADALILAQLSDAVLLTVLGGTTRRSQLLSTFNTLSRQIPDHAVLGLVLDGITYAHA